MIIGELNDIARRLVAPAKGILAADESTNTIKRRFDSINVESTEQSRRDYREMLFRTPGANEFISGVILYDETIRQRRADGGLIVNLLREHGIIPGIKVDKSTNPLANTDGELITDGLDGLRDRLREYHALGARFTKWRAVITIGDGIPSQYCIDANAHMLGRFAALSQEAQLVPIVEPEVLMDGDHSIEQCHDVTLNALRSTYDELARQRVDLTGTLLKSNMVISGKDAAERADAHEVATRTLDAFMREVPAAVPGIVFLSGGQSDDEATENLNAINVAAEFINTPWELSFSYGRALQAAPLKAWGGDSANNEAAQQEYYRRAMLTSAARQGKYTPGMGTR
jgi:fructose-bisphosphate aldolase class I